KRPLKCRPHHLGLCAFRLLRFLAAFVRADLLRTRSGSLFPPVSRFQSSNVWFEIFPSTRSSANLRLWALLLNGTVLATFDYRNAIMVALGFRALGDFRARPAGMKQNFIVGFSDRLHGFAPFSLCG